jgi:Zn-dependent peptidase ImmA (M78 family)
MPLSKNATFLRRLVLEADSLATRSAKSQFPVLLRPLAESRRVTSVEFRPLLVDAMLTTHPNGFRILFNSNGESPYELLERYENECRSKVMSSRLRFSLAHELAHTLFYDLSETTPKVARLFRSGGGRTALENLERNCNKLASHLLLPTTMLRAEFLKIKTINPKSILEFADKAGVSLESLIRRLNENNSLFIQRYFKGCIVLVEQTREATNVRAIAKPQGLNIAHELFEMRANGHWKLASYDGSEVHPAFLPSMSSALLKIKTQMTVSQKSYTIATAKIRSFEASTSYLMTFEENER